MPLDAIVDQKRLEAVRSTGLLDTQPEQAFDDLTRLAATLTGAPYAFATVVDDARSFWKSCFGIPADAPHQNTVEESFCQYVVRSRRELVIADATVDIRTKNNPSVEAMGVRAWAGFPLMSPGGEVLGSFCIVDTVPREWSDRDVEILRTLADAAAREIALRASIHDERLARARAETLAHTLQESLLPPLLPAIDGLDMAARYRPAGTGVELGGDFYDIFQTAFDRYSVVVGDVCGKGVKAARVALLARHAVSVAAMRTDDPVDVIRWLNETLISRSPDSELFLTALYATLRYDEGAFYVRISSAGHVQPIVQRAGGEVFPIDIKGPLAGIWPAADFDEQQITLRGGDSLIFYTDGITEARSANECWGEDALFELIAQAGPLLDADELAERIVDAAVSFSGGLVADDIAVVVMRVLAIET